MNNPILPFRLSQTAAALCMVAMGTSTSLADVILWTCPSGGSYASTTCWDGGVIPDASDTVYFDTGGSYIVLTSQNRDVDSLIISDDVTFGLSDTYTVSGSLDVVSNIEGESATLVLASSSMDIASGLVLGGFPNMPGNLNIRAGAMMDYGYLINYSGSSITFGINDDVPLTRSVMTQNSGGDPLFEGTLRIEAEDGIRPPAGTVYTLLDFGFFGVGEEFDVVVTVPPPGREYIVQGNEFGSNTISVTVEDRTWVPVPEITPLDEPSDDPPAMELGDLNGDGLDDIIYAVSGELTILVNDGVGGTTSIERYTIATDPVDIAVGDFDGDDTVDLVVLDQNDSTMTFFYNPSNDPAALDTPLTYSTESNPVAIVACNLGEPSGFVVSRLRDTLVISKNPGKATGHQSKGNGEEPQVIGWVEVEDDPGPADSTDEEERDDDDTNVAVGHSGASGFNGPSSGPSLSMIRTQDASPFVTLVSNTTLNSVPVSITGARLADLGGFVENQVVVGTADGTLAIFDQVGNPLAEVPVSDDGILAVAAGNADGMDITYDDIVVSTFIDGSPAIELYSNGGLGDAIALERTNSIQPTARVTHLLSGPLFDFTGIEVGIAGFNTDSTDNPRETFEILYNRTVLLPCTDADFNGDGVVDGGDIGLLIAAWGPCPLSTCPYDLNGDENVDGGDLGLFLNYWGPCSS
jgi:hypothetical protein